MDYWAETMQDDAYLIAADGWVAPHSPHPGERTRRASTKDKGWTCDLVPKPLIVARYFATEQAAIDAQQAELKPPPPAARGTGGGTRRRGGLLSVSLDKIAKAEINARLKEIKGDTEAKDEAVVLRRWLDLADSETALKRQSRSRTALDKLAYDKYPKLTEDEIKTLVVDDKWLATLAAAVQGELDRVSQTLTGRIRELAERYATPLPKLTDEVATLAARVEEHLKKMGALWK